MTDDTTRALLDIRLRELRSAMHRIKATPELAREIADNALQHDARMTPDCVARIACAACVTPIVCRRDRGCRLVRHV